MTREEAIEVLQQDIPCERDTDLIEALDMAINALELQPCEDCISRQSVLEEINRVGIKAFKTYNDYSQLFDFIDTLPPVKPQERTGHWNLFHTTEHGMREDSYFKCDRCNYESYKEYNFCPNCGAKMQAESEVLDANTD